MKGEQESKGGRRRGGGEGEERGRRGGGEGEERGRRGGGEGEERGGEEDANHYPRTTSQSSLDLRATSCFVIACKLPRHRRVC